MYNYISVLIAKRLPVYRSHSGPQVEAF